MKNNLVKIIATFGLIVVIALILKGIFGVGKIGFSKITNSDNSKKIGINKTIIACEGWTGKIGTHYLAYDDEYIWYHWDVSTQSFQKSLRIVKRKNSSDFDIDGFVTGGGDRVSINSKTGKGFIRIGVINLRNCIEIKNLP
mgnify:CR=1 FL=1